MWCPKRWLIGERWSEMGQLVDCSVNHNCLSNYYEHLRIEDAINKLKNWRNCFREMYKFIKSISRIDDRFDVQNQNETHKIFTTFWFFSASRTSHVGTSLQLQQALKSLKIQTKFCRSMLTNHTLTAIVTKLCNFPITWNSFKVVCWAFCRGLCTWLLVNFDN